MYHLKFKGKHYEIGYKWGKKLFENNFLLLQNIPFTLTKEHKDFAKKSEVYYNKFFPEVLEEIRGVADGQNTNYTLILSFLLSMYCIIPSCNCSCLVLKNDKNIILGRNSDFLTKLEKLYINCIYKLSNNYSFIGNSTSFIEIEDGINEFGLAVGFTSIYPIVVDYGFNSGMIIRMILEKCKNVDEGIELLNKIPIASSQTFVLADISGEIALVECNCKKIEVYKNFNENSYFISTNIFQSESMKKYNKVDYDNWFSQERYQTLEKFLNKNFKICNVEEIKKLLAGENGFMCQYDRKTGKDTVWSSIYDLKSKKIWRVEGNPKRKKFIEEDRFKF